MERQEKKTWEKQNAIVPPLEEGVNSLYPQPGNRQSWGGGSARIKSVEGKEEGLPRNTQRGLWPQPKLEKRDSHRDTTKFGGKLSDRQLGVGSEEEFLSQSRKGGIGWKRKCTG